VSSSRAAESAETRKGGWSIGLTTVHTHLRRSREKLGLPSGDALIGYAARYFFVPPAGGNSESPVTRKRSG
jgi:hypothetical protein